MRIAKKIEFGLRFVVFFLGSLMVCHLVSCGSSPYSSGVIGLQNRMSFADVEPFSKTFAPGQIVRVSRVANSVDVVYPGAVAHSKIESQPGWSLPSSARNRIQRKLRERLKPIAGNDPFQVFFREPRSSLVPQGLLANETLEQVRSSQQLRESLSSEVLAYGQLDVLTSVYSARIVLTSSTEGLDAFGRAFERQGVEFERTSGDSLSTSPQILGVSYDTRMIRNILARLESEEPEKQIATNTTTR